MNILKLLNSSIVTTSRILFCQISTKRSDVLTLLTAMPKKSKEGRNNFCTTQSNFSVQTTYLEVLGSGADGVPSSVMLVTNYGSYLINCGEGTTKLSNEYKIKSHKCTNVFITYPRWKNISGLFGMALAVQESKIGEYFIHGDPDIESIFYAVHKFVNLRFLRVRVKECKHYGEYSDGIVSVKYVFLHPTGFKRNVSESSILTQSQSSHTDCEIYNSFLKKNEREKSCCNKVEEGKGSELKNQQKRRCMNYAISYIFQTAGSQGALNLEKCLEHGVPPGPLLGQLKNGIDITLEDGRVIRSKDVKEPDLPGVNVIALECPTEDYLDSLLEEPAFFQFQSGKTPAETVIHFTSSGIVKNSKYQEWLNRFPKATIHLFINEDNKRTGSVGIHRQQYKLNSLHPEIFPLLDDSGIPEFPRTDNSCIQPGHKRISVNFPPYVNLPIYRDKIYFKCESNSFINAETLCQIYLKPKNNYDYSRSIVLKKEEFFKEMLENEEIKQKIEESKQELKELEQKMNSDNRIYPKIVFLGTGSSKPSKLRNGSGILIFTNSSKSILLDCGENTFGQLVSLYGLSKTREILRSLEAIYVSHMHIDHHMGLITLLKERKRAFDELDECISLESIAVASPEKISKKFSPVFVLGPVQMMKWFLLFTDKFEDISELFQMIPNSDMVYDFKRPNEKISVCVDKLDLKSIKTVPVVHCPNSFGISIIHKDGWKITYSGDTRPCQALIDLGMNSDILIHEATLEDAYVKEARVKLHSTTSQAIDVGKRMKAKYILLTHFSQRYCHLPNIDPSFSDLNVGIAFDFMEVPFNKLPLLPALIRPLQYALSKYDEINKTTTGMILRRKEKMMHVISDLKDLGRPAKISKTSY